MKTHLVIYRVVIRFAFGTEPAWGEVSSAGNTSILSPPACTVNKYKYSSERNNAENLKGTLTSA